MKTIESLQKDSLAYRLYDKIKNEGEHRTINEWAEKFDTLPAPIQSALGRLRKANCHLHPVGTVTDLHNPEKSKKGVVVDIMEREEWFQEVYERGMKNRVIPGIKDFYHKTETAVRIFPSLRQSLTVAFNTVFSYLKTGHESMRLATPKDIDIHAVKPGEDREKVLEEIFEQIK